MLQFMFQSYVIIRKCSFSRSIMKFISFSQVITSLKTWCKSTDHSFFSRSTSIEWNETRRVGRGTVTSFLHGSLKSLAPSRTICNHATKPVEVPDVAVMLQRIGDSSSLQSASTDRPHSDHWNDELKWIGRWTKRSLHGGSKLVVASWNECQWVGEFYNLN